MNLAQVIQLINSDIVPNGNNEITANVLRHILIEMLQQPNDLIGDLGDLSTIDNDNLVNALNSLKNEVDNFQPIEAYKYKDTVDTYSDLSSLTGLEIGDGYVNSEDGLVYVWNGTSFPAEGDGIDVSMKPIGVVEEGNEFAVSGGEVYEKLSKNKIPDWVEGDTYTGGVSPDQVLESGQVWRVKPHISSTTERPSESDDWEPMIYVDVHVADVDRPDLEEFKVIDEVENVVFKTNSFDYHRVEPIEGVDRPDIALIIVDSDGNVIWTSEDKSNNDSGSVDTDSVKEVVKTSELITTFWEPPLQEAYNVGSSNDAYWESYDYWGIFDEVRINQKIAQGYSPYVTRELLGKSTVGDYDIYRYEFKPPNPTRKVIITSSIHGSERIPAMVIQRFFKALCEDWMHDPTLTWARHNIHFVVIPLVSPFGFHKRNRRVWETEPFPASWTKSGNVVTVTFDISDFPNNNPNVSANDYFTASEGVAGNTWISLIDSSDQGAIPDDGYRIATVIDGQTVTVTTEESGGASSGTCNIFVSVDPNKNFDLPAAPWEDVTTSSSKSAFTDPVAVSYNNKGTKPYSLNETKFVADTFDLHSDATFAVDMHNGAADYDTRYGTGLGIDLTPLNVLNAMHASFTDGDMPIGSSISNVASQYGSRMYDINSFTIEWGQHNNITEEIATESQRWMSNFILVFARYFNKKINE